MPQTSAPTPRPQSAPRTGQRMDFAPHRGNVAPQPRLTTPATAKAAARSTAPTTTKPIVKPTTKPTTRPVAKPAPKPVSGRPTPTAPRRPTQTTPRRPALITSAREAMNAHRSTQDATVSTTPAQGTTESTSPRSATRLHRTPVSTVPERTRVTPMPTLPPPPPRPAAPVRAGTDPLVQRARPLKRTAARSAAPKQQIKVSAPTPPPPRNPSPSPRTSTSTPHRTKDPEDTSLNNARYALGEKSPFFLQSVSVEKRPLSSGRPSTRPATRKNIYPKKPAEPKPEKPSLPTIVVPDSHRSKAPLIALIIFTILLGALVGAAAYLFFFQ